MIRRELPPSLKNYVFEQIQANGMDPMEFTWTVVTGQYSCDVSHIEHRKTGFYFLFDVGNSAYYTSSWPGHKNGPLQTDTLIKLITAWTQSISADITAPDLWALAAERKRIGTDPNQANAPFTPDEQKQIEAGLFQLEEFVYQSEPDLSEEKRHAVSARFGYLKAAIARLGRLDWTSLVVGQLFSMVAEKIITVQTFTAAYNVAANLLTKFLNAGATIAGRLMGS